MKRLTLLTALSLSAFTLHAQTANEAVIDRANQPGLPPGQPPAGDTPTGQEIITQTDSGDAGVQRLAEPRKLPFKLSLSVDSQVYFTDNVQLADDSSPSSDSDAVVVGNTLSLRLTGNPWTAGEGLLVPSAAIVYQNFRHGIGSDNSDRKDLDFDAYSLPLTLTYRFGQGWEATAGATGSAVYRIHGDGGYTRIVASFTPNVGLRKLVPVSQNQLLVISGSLSRSFTQATRDGVPAGFDPFRADRNDKTDVTLDLTHYILKGDWTFVPYVRFTQSAYAHYEEAGFPAAQSINRDDSTVSAGLVVSYKVNDWLNARAFTGYEKRDSSESIYSYDAGTIGLGLSANINF